MEGGGGIVAVELATTIDSDDTTIEVASTADFRDDEIIIIGDEHIMPGSTTSTTFLTCTRGYDDTTAVAHTAGAIVYTHGASMINNAMGFNVAATADEMGFWAVVTIPFNFMTKTLPHVVSMNYSFLTGEAGIIGWFILALGAGMIIALALQLVGGRRV